MAAPTQETTATSVARPDDDEFASEQERGWTTQEDEDEGPQTLAETINEICESFFASVSEEEIRTYQKFVESIQNKRIAEGAVQAPARAPDFTLIDQDDEEFHLQSLLENGPVVISFYRGKWCPFCNATLAHLQKHLSEIKAKGATLVAISPMLPDGTKDMSTKQLLEYPVLSDVGNGVARQFRITFPVQSEFHETFTDWGEHVPSFNGDSSWEIPIAATYIVNQQGFIVWSHLDNDPGNRAEAKDIIQAIPEQQQPVTTTATIIEGDVQGGKQVDTKNKSMLSSKADPSSSDFVKPSSSTRSGRGCLWKLKQVFRWRR